MSALSSLYLAPRDIRLAPAWPGIERVLSELGVTGAPIGAGDPAPGGGRLFLAGEGFSRHVVFAGCSPYLRMTPPTDGDRRFCHVALHGPFAQPRLVVGGNAVKPRCPACRVRFDDWRTHLDDWRAGRPACCGRCGKCHPATALDWRDHAAVGRVLIELRNVFPGEASPGDLLMSRLEAATAIAWRHAWAPYLDD